jgi:hypothetical protein
MRAPPPRTTILVPRGAEAAAVRRARPRARVVEVTAGAAAASALPAFDDGEAVVVLGLCGALRGLRTGDVAVYERVADETRALVLDPALAAALSGALHGASIVSACTAERIVTTVSVRTALAARFDADVVDMEGTHLAVALRARGVPFAMVRVVSDDASRDLPAIGDAIDAEGRIRPLRIAVAFARAPRTAFAFVQGVRRALATLTIATREVERR